MGGMGKCGLAENKSTERVKRQRRRLQLKGTMEGREDFRSTKKKKKERNEILVS